WHLFWPHTRETPTPVIARTEAARAPRRCNVSNRPDRRNGSYPFTPSSITRSTFNAILFPATRSALSEAKRSRIGRQRRRPELDPSPAEFVRPKPSSRDSTAARAGGEVDRGAGEPSARSAAQADRPDDRSWRAPGPCEGAAGAGGEAERGAGRAGFKVRCRVS